MRAFHVDDVRVESPRERRARDDRGDDAFGGAGVDDQRAGKRGAQRIDERPIEDARPLAVGHPPVNRDVIGFEPAQSTAQA